jgi:hypothetical protein
MHFVIFSCERYKCSFIHRPAYIAGVTNPIFETSTAWDILMDIGTARVVVHKDIHVSFPPTIAPPALVNPMMARPLKAENSTGSEDDIQRIATRDGKDGNQKNEFAAKPDNLDNMFIEDVGPTNAVASPCSRRDLISIGVLADFGDYLTLWGDTGADAIYRVCRSFCSTGIAIRGGRGGLDSTWISKHAICREVLGQRYCVSGRGRCI